MHPQKLTCPLKDDGWKMTFLFEMVAFLRGQFLWGVRLVDKGEKIHVKEFYFSNFLGSSKIIHPGKTNMGPEKGSWKRKNISPHHHV